MGRISLILSALLLFCVVVPALSGEHSLFYTYTALSQPIKLPGIYEFVALGMLDDRELDYYNSETQEKVPKQNWMSEKMTEDYWQKGTQSRKSKEQWFKVNVGILMERMRHNNTDLHVLQWRHGCVVDEGAEGNVKFLRGVDEYSYDGTEFLSFDEANSRWIAPVQAAEPTKRKWDDVHILNQYTKGYLEKECVDWLTKFMDYGKEMLKKHSPPDVHLFVTKSRTGPGKLTLTCLATGFYPKDVQMQVRKSRTSLPEHLVTSSGVRPNGDNTYQLRKSVEIKEDEKELYDCYVNHLTLEEAIIASLPKEGNSPSPAIIGGAIVVLLVVLAVIGVLVFLKKRGIFGGEETSPAASTGSGSVSILQGNNADQSSAPCIDKKDNNDENDSGQGSSKGSSQESIPLTAGTESDGAGAMNV